MRVEHSFPILLKHAVRFGSFIVLSLIGLSVNAAPQEPFQEIVEQYVSMCTTDAIHIPLPHGEADLKGHPKLVDYCKCFGSKFARRAINLASSHSTLSSEESMAQEQVMRNECRKQFGLPQVKF